MQGGVPSEVKPGEHRVGLTPTAVREYVTHGHQVLVQAGAGTGAGYSDEAYERAGAKTARSRRSRASSTPVWLAASISTTSREPPPSRLSSTQLGQTPQGVSVGPSTQFRQRARMRADVVLPHPRGPLNR